MKDENICLLFGAGVSFEQKLPSWKKLVEGLSDFYDMDLIIEDNNLIESIGVIENTRINNIEKLLKEIGASPEKDKQWARQQIASAVKLNFKKVLINEDINTIQSRMNLMEKLVTIAHNRACDRKLTTIITYNYDDYFEFTYRCLFPNDYENDVESYNMSYPRHLPSGNERKPVNIYHVHGRICIFDELFGHCLTGEDIYSYRDRHDEEYRRDLSEGIIFSGNDYNSLMEDKIVGWTNLVQYIFYSQLPITVVGFSMTDANFRLLLRRMKKSEEIIKSLTFYIGYASTAGIKKELDPEYIKAANTRLNVDYLMEGVCPNPECKVIEFNKLPDEIYNQLKS